MARKSRVDYISKLEDENARLRHRVQKSKESVEDFQEYHDIRQELASQKEAMDNMRRVIVQLKRQIDVQDDEDDSTSRSGVYFTVSAILRKFRDHYSFEVNATNRRLFRERLIEFCRRDIPDYRPETVVIGGRNHNVFSKYEVLRFFKEYNKNEG